MRFKSFLQALTRAKCDGLLITNPLNIAYLTGFTKSQGYLIITREGRKIYFTNPIYKDIAKSFKGWEVIVKNPGSNILGLVAKIIKRMRFTNLGFEEKNISYANYRFLREAFSQTNIELKATGNLVEILRMVKTPKELRFIRKSAQITKEALCFIEETFHPALREKDLSLNIDRFLRQKGDNETAFSTIVAAGSNTAFAHHIPTELKIGSNFFLTDLGSKYYGYCADLTRVFFWGKMPLLFKKIYATVQKAQELSLKKIKEGVKASDIDKAARNFIERKGWGKNFTHGLGHGVGLEVHELPSLSPKSDIILKKGMVVTVEPAIYIKGKFGVRLEKMVLVKENSQEVL
ncbi:MAG: Xaa-Pro peptidase family protein [Candidatus Omnitrophica bacterium]|nr:Xaa-Pro peptidase family protein [Candidatus Omnitrophota bacterium]MDD5429748.1 Xaa-Pro peptidase family protein [Candidatus Omnitrophota bacterium]